MCKPDCLLYELGKKSFPTKINLTKINKINFFLYFIKKKKKIGEKKFSTL